MASALTSALASVPATAALAALATLAALASVLSAAVVVELSTGQGAREWRSAGDVGRVRHNGQARQGNQQSLDLHPEGA